jgi:hypothetical protein
MARGPSWRSGRDWRRRRSERGRCIVETKEERLKRVEEAAKRLAIARAKVAKSRKLLDNWPTKKTAAQREAEAIRDEPLFEGAD